MYTPAHKLSANSPTSPLLHKTELGKTPPDGIMVALPLQAPQLASTVLLILNNIGGGGSAIFTVLMVLHPALSVTVTLYCPAHKPDIAAVICPPGVQL